MKAKITLPDEENFKTFGIIAFHLCQVDGARNYLDLLPRLLKGIYFTKINDFM